MNETALREELKQYYRRGDDVRAKAFAEKCFRVLDEQVQDGMSALEQKALQYNVIADQLEPKVFRFTPFYFETGALTSLSDGALWAKGHGFVQAAGWTYIRNEHLFRDRAPEALSARDRQCDECMYLICGPFNDVVQHFNFNNRPILQSGLKGIYHEAKAELAKCENRRERDFLSAVCTAMLALKKAAEKFAFTAAQMLESEADPIAVQNLQRIAETAARVPWEAPKTFYEALNTLAFMRKMLGTLEGIGPNTFGRVDVDLYPFYRADIKAGTLTDTQGRELIAQFLIGFDMHYDHDMKMVGYSDHELENTYTLGGCDENGKPVYNELTRLFLDCTREYNIIIPKIICRFGADSPKEYLNRINTPIINGTSTVLLQNDDATIPATVFSGRTLREARDYIVSGCWDVSLMGLEKHDCGNYVNLLKPFEFALHRLTDKMKQVGMSFEFFDNCRSFEELYKAVLENCRRLFHERIRVSKAGGSIWKDVAPLPIFSSTLTGAIQKHKDYTASGAKYRDDYFFCFGFPEMIDSLLAIKELVFEQKKYTLSRMLEAVRHNWQGEEEMRSAAIACHGWGDGSEASCTLANRFCKDLYYLANRIKGTFGGRVHIGFLTYTEIRWWGEKTLATPNGRFHGDYFAQGLTPSRLKKIASVTDVIYSLSRLDATLMAANNVVNIILPATRMTPALCEGFLRAAAGSALMSLQLNCTTKEQLLDAQLHPEQYPNLIVRVCGFSAKFTSLSPDWQKEVLSRNFYD